MIKIALPIAALTTALTLGEVRAECWVASNIRGQSAEAPRGYAFAEDTFSDGMRVCFYGGTGFVSNNDLDLVQFGQSTLIGVSVTQAGLETVNAYQLDRTNRKLLIIQSRIGTATIVPLLPDYAAVFVGDVVPARD